MLPEVHTAAAFVANLLKSYADAETRERFTGALVAELQTRFAGHWYPESPLRGSGLRCIQSVRGGVDPSVAEAALRAGIAGIADLLPSELYVWIDPASVAYRIGDNGSICDAPVVGHEQHQQQIQQPIQPMMHQHIHHGAIPAPLETSRLENMATQHGYPQRNFLFGSLHSSARKMFGDYTAPEMPQLVGPAMA
eukprot:m.204681 g.204681  ORF g.204681 m.204681 type:complete len:194 (+) comp10698_c6_seq1:86-667(+)